MKGRVTLLGAGPGDPELLTLIGKRRLKEADVVLYDRLIDPSLLAFTDDHAKLVDVGKMPKHHRVRQAQINQMLVKYAQDGKRVVRLKAGDPYVFGRGGEEAQELQKADVTFEVIPGITSAIAGLAAVGIPITHRDYASSFHIITGHHKRDGQQIDWENVAHQEGTLVFLMGMAQLPNICQQLITHGKAPQTPVAIIQWATQWRQRMVTGDLTTINDLVNRHHIGAPALIVVGAVVQLAKQLNVRHPLQGIHLLVPYSQRGCLASQLVDQGATVDFYPRNSEAATKSDLTALDQHANILFTSVAAFKQFVNQLTANGRDLRELSQKKIWVLNPVVERHLRQWGIVADGIVTGKVPADCVEIGGERSQTAADAFIGVYRKQAPHFTLPFDLAEFSAVLLPSNDSLNDFASALTTEQRQQLGGLMAFTMGRTIAANADKLGFDKVINCPSKIAATIRAVREEFDD